MIASHRHARRLLALACGVLVPLAAACTAGRETGAGDSATAPASAPTPASARPTTVADDERAIRAVLDQWYVAMQAADSAGTVAPLTPEFLLLEDTLPLTGPELVARLKEGAGAKWTAAFSDLRTRVRGDVAWTTLRNHEESTAPDGKRCQADFLETIVFVRDGGDWRIDRYHAAAFHRWHCP
ncbi:MAG TPA: nuclear transport factor 2 family protein [Gemmatimonadaceae bacterium]|nr:nuclear transport factor 2 family protein [Gemmatimonadaceae bacterium]